MNDIIKIVQTLEDYNMDTVGASLLGNLFAGKGFVRASSENKKEKEL